ncbi:hypothetical protein DFH28DRAFT_907262 [Melampsora americana]|nr:hypothetical protein DFH28DRAFT_907262 [Melampsora americana]
MTTFINRRAAQSAQELLDSLPPSLRYAKSSSKQSKYDQNNRANNRGDTGANNKEKDNIDPGQGGSSGSEEEEEPQNSPKSNSRNHQEPFQTSSSDNPSINLPMGRARRAEWEKLADLFHLESTYRADALRISSITGSQNQFQASVCLMQQVLQELGKKTSDSHDGVHDTESSTAWTPRSDFGTRIINVMHLTLKDHTIEAYTNTVYADKTPIIGSFHRKTMQALMGKTPAWKAETLPPDFGDTLDDLTAHVKFMGGFKDRLRHQRDNFRVILLKNIRVTAESVNEDLLPVPTMKELLGDVRVYISCHDLARWFGPDSRTNDEIEAATDATARARFAYLTTKYCLSTEKQKKLQFGKSQWDWIDAQLSTLRSKDRAYRRAFDSVILARDEYYFDGKKTIEDIQADEHGFNLPTEADIFTAVEFVASQHNH